MMLRKPNYASPLYVSGNKRTDVQTNSRMKKILFILIAVSTCVIAFGQTFNSKKLFYDIPIDKNLDDLIDYIRHDSSFKIVQDYKTGLDFKPKQTKPIFGVQPYNVTFFIRPIKFFYDSVSYLSFNMIIDFSKEVGRAKTGKVYQKIYDALKGEYSDIKREEGATKVPLKDGGYEIVALIRNFFYSNKNSQDYQFDMTWMYICKKCDQSIIFSYRLKEKQ